MVVKWNPITPRWSGEYVPERNVKINWRDWETTNPSMFERHFCVASLDEPEPWDNHVHMKDIVRLSSPSGWRAGEGLTSEMAQAHFSSFAQCRKVSIDRVICSIKVNGKHTTSRSKITKRIAAATGGEVIIPWNGKMAAELGYSDTNPYFIQCQKDYATMWDQMSL